MDRSQKWKPASFELADAAALTARFELTDKAIPELQSIYRHVVRYEACLAETKPTSARIRNFQSGAKYARRLEAVLGEIDIRILVEAMGAVEVTEAGLMAPAETLGLQERDPLIQNTYVVTAANAPFRVYQYETFRNTLRGVAQAFDKAALTTHVAIGKPPPSDALTMGCEWLYKLWLDRKKERPTNTFNKGRFGDLAEQFLNGHCGFEVDKVRTAVRRIVEQHTAH